MYPCVEQNFTCFNDCFPLKECVVKIQKSGLPYTIFYPSNFMENLKGGMKQGKKIMTMGNPIHKLWWIAAEDYGRQVANAFKTELSLNKGDVVQGTEPLTTKEASTIYVKNYTKEKLTVGSLPMRKVLKYLLSSRVKPPSPHITPVIPPFQGAVQSVYRE